MKLSRPQFEELALQQMDTLYRAAMRMTRDPAKAEDLVQETVLRALRAADRFELEQYGIRPWLLRIMHNLHSTRGERDSRQPRAVADEQLTAVADAHDADNISIVPLSANDERLFDTMDERLAEALNELPGEYQQVLLYWAIEDLTYKEIASVLSVPVGTVMSRLFRARQRLAERLKSFAAEQRIPTQ